ncbi:MAG: glycoside hydrolase [Spirochaetia bacterium]|nr:glycoside hydrolase [Spirochaetia bacterium]
MKKQKYKKLFITLALCLTAGSFYLAAKTAGKWGKYTLESYDIYIEDEKVHFLILEKDALWGRQKIRYLQRSSLNNDIIQESEIISYKTSNSFASVCHSGNDVQIASYKDKIIAVWQGLGTGYKNRGQMMTAVSYDNGKNWNIQPEIIEDQTKGDQGFFDIAADSKGNLHLTWLDKPENLPKDKSGKALRYSTSTDFGKTWSKKTTVDEETCFCCQNKIKINSSDESYILYRDAHFRDMALAKMNNNTWQRQGFITHFKWEFNGCPHVGGGFDFSNDGNLHAVSWMGQKENTGVYYVYSKNNGISWSKPKKIGSDDASHPDIAVNKQAIVIVWDEIQNGKKIIKSVISKDNGISWSEPELLSNIDYLSKNPRVVFINNEFYVFYKEKTNEIEKLNFTVLKLKNKNGEKML